MKEMGDEGEVGESEPFEMNFYQDSDEGLLTHEEDYLEQAAVTSPEVPPSAAGNVNQTQWTDLDYMKKMWEEDTGKSVCQKSSDSRELNRVTTELDTWYRLNVSKANIWDLMTAVTPDGGVRIRILNRGSGQTVLAPGMYFIMQYTGFVEPNFKEPVDATRYRGRREVFKYDVNEAFVEGLRLALGKLRLGDSAHIRISPEYAFGNQGIPPRIPPSATMHYIVELRDEEWSDDKASSQFIRQPEDAKEDLGFEVCFKAATEFREKGKKAFGKNLYESARDHFEYGIEATSVCMTLLERPSEAVADMVAKVSDIDTVLKRNASVVHAKLSKWERVEELCRKIVELNPHDSKGLYYLATANFQIGKKEEAFEWVQRGIRENPHSPEYAELYQKIKKVHDKSLNNEKVMCMRMFGNACHTAKAVNQSAEPSFVISDEVREHVGQTIDKMRKCTNLAEVPLKYSLFQDKHNRKFLEAETRKAGLLVVAREGQRRPIFTLCRQAAISH
ncbi:inactive peptidyl-prolyl cis-trans isomerase FKBP6-like [Paramacrobiotus metropolitanus]|uniref:inactive peptidyl-prolyl cis-trans isomerase FKBP6-like n=1 Tax=Paramacrobiotus metropolitanus TaxID=2943436 RepID=UPI002445BEA6|nr:inactive peptidyl-prolyl cis-trans isomerase FKBP6-like [Paramacrobiotus metropolitanus]